MISSLSIENTAFPTLTTEELEHVAQIAHCQEFADGEYLFRAGDEYPDVYVVREGGISIRNPAENDMEMTVHGVGQFSGDIDILTGRPAPVDGVAVGYTRCCRIPNKSLREVLTKVPRLSEKLLTAFQMRRHLLLESGRLGIKVVGYARCHHTTLIREFLHKNFVPHTFYDVDTISDTELTSLDVGNTFPVVRCVAHHDLIKPTPRDVAEAAGIWRHCPVQKIDVAIIGAGPAGLAAAVYSASEGLSTIVIDSLGPGGQAGTSSKIENFIGFPAGLTGIELSTRGVLQMLKFGAEMVAPVLVEKIEPPVGGCGYHSVYLDCGTVVKARVVLIATGVKWRKLEAKGAAAFERAGVYYACTAIEALLHDQEDVIVVGAGNSAGQAAMYLAECCSNRTVHMTVRGVFGQSMSEYLTKRIKATKNIVVHEGTTVTEVHSAGGGKIGSVTLNENGTSTTVGANAVFVFIGSEPATSWLPADIALDDKGFVLTGAQVTAAKKWPLDYREPCPLETSVPGILAAGDVRSGSTKRVGFAVGDGSQAVSCIHTLLTMIEEHSLPVAESRL